MLLCFDFDGVIVDSLAQQLRIVTEAQKRIELGRVPTVQDFREISDLSYEGFARRIEIPVESLEKWKSTVVELLLQDTEEVPVFPEMPGVLSELGSRFPIVIVTSNVRDAVERTLTKHALTNFVEDILDGRMRASKGERIALASRNCGIPLSSTYFIGDTISDMRHAKAAGSKSIAVCWGYQSRELLQSTAPDAFVTIPRELLSYFGTLDVH